MAIEKLNIGTKTANQGVNASGKLTAVEFNQLVAKVNEMIDAHNSRVFISQDEYQQLADSDAIVEGVEYNVFEE